MKKAPTLCAPSKVSCENGKVVEFYFPQILFEIVKMRRFQQAGGKSGKVFLSHFRLGGRGRSKVYLIFNVLLFSFPSFPF